MSHPNTPPETEVVTPSGECPLPKETWTVKGRDGSDWVFEIDRGSKSDASSGKFERASRARFVDAEGRESYVHWNEFEDCLKLASSSLRPELRGQGIGLALYKKIVDEAALAGKGFHSDSSVSSEALKIYHKLAALGYKVEYAPDENVSMVPHVARGDLERSRPEGSCQLVGRDEASIARVLPPGAATAATLPPIYLMNVLTTQVVFDWGGAGQNLNGAPSPESISEAGESDASPPGARGLKDKLRARRADAEARLSSTGPRVTSAMKV